MNSKSKIIFLILLICFLILCIFLNYIYFSKKCLNNNLSEMQIMEIKESRQEYKKNIDLYITNKIIPFSYVDNFYLLYLEKEDDYKRIYTKSDFKIELLKKENDHNIRLFLYNDKFYKEVSIELTNIPVIYITNEKTINLYGFDSDIYQYEIDYSIRGNSSKNSDKKSYTLNFKNNKLDISLLGMNASDTWILNPIYFDNSYIREKLSYDIWNNLSTQFNHSLEYVEVVMNNEYQGLYYLQEKVDLETFDGDALNDLLISIQDMDINEEFNYRTVDVIDNRLNEFEIEEGLQNAYELKLDIIESLKNILANEESSIKLEYDITNSVNYSVFLNTTMALDSVYKNQKIIFRKENDSYLIQKTVWDLDWTFQNENVTYLYPVINDDINIINTDLCIPSYILNNTIFKKLEKMRYFIFRRKFYNETNLYILITKYVNYLNKFGAVERDSYKWNNHNFKESINVIMNFIRRRIQVLDEYYGGL